MKTSRRGFLKSIAGVALSRRPNLEVDYKVRLQNGQTVWTRLTSVEVGDMIDGISDAIITLKSIHKAKEESIQSATTIQELEGIDLNI